MGMSSSVQFYGIKPVLQAYQNRDVEAWSLWQGKQYLFRGIGYDALSAYLNMLDEAGSGAVYTLKVYDDIEDEKKIKETTPADGSFNFRFTDQSEYVEGKQGRQRVGRAETGNDSLILGKLEAMEERLRAMEHPEPESKLGVIGEILEHPALAPMLPKLVEILAGFLTGKPGQNSQGQGNYLTRHNTRPREDLQF